MASIAYSWQDKAEQYGTGLGFLAVGGLFLWWLMRKM